MTQFFFHFLDGESEQPDDIGLECGTPEQAYLEAVAAARAMWPELLAERRDPRHCAFSVADQDGEQLFRLDFSELLDDCRNPLRYDGHPSAVTMDSLRETHRRASNAKAHLRSSFDDVRESLAEANALMARLATFEHPRPPLRRPA